MRLAVISHKICRKDETSPSGYGTDGGFSRQIGAISELFDETNVVVPFEKNGGTAGLTPLAGKKMRIGELSTLDGAGLRRKAALPFWLLRNGTIIWREVKRADAVHAPIPGEIGTIGLLFALLQKKPLFVRHCGNWTRQRTVAEHFWKWLMEKYAGGRNVMLATGGAQDAPSRKNPHVRWIFSTSLRRSEMAAAESKQLPADGRLKLIIVCRQEPRKGTRIVIESLPLVLARFPHASLDVVGDGSLLENMKKRAKILGLEEKIKFHGQIGQAKVIGLLNRAHVFCFPTSASEGFPKAVLEALAGGLPVITTRVSVLSELIQTGGNGHLLDRPTGEALAAAVREICSDARKYREMSARAIETAQDYSLENWRDQIGDKLRRAWNVSSLSGGG